MPDFEISTLREKLAAPANPIEPLAPIEPTPQSQRPHHSPSATPRAHATDHGHEHSGDGTGLGPTPLPPGQVLPADQIKGRMTLREVSDQCAVPLDQLLAALNLPPILIRMWRIKDLISQGTLSDVTGGERRGSEIATMNDE